MNKKTGLERNVHMFDNAISEEKDSYRSYEQQLEDNVRKLA